MLSNDLPSVFVAAEEKRQMVGICSEECSLNPKMGLSCPAGTVCKSNGCGHTCQKDDGSAAQGQYKPKT